MFTLKTLATAAFAALLAAPGFAQAADKLIVGTQDPGFPHIIEASGVLKDAPYEIEFAVLPGPAAQLPAIYSKSIDLAWLGDTSLILEQGKGELWTAETAPFQIIAGWTNNDKEYRNLVTVVRNSANVKELADLKGKSWSFNFGGINHLQYIMSLAKAGLKESDIEPVQLGDGYQAAAAFNAGQVDVYSGDYVRVKDLIDKGEARIILDSDELGIPALTVFAARTDAINDEKRSALIADFLGRVGKLWEWYKPNLDTAAKIYTDKVKFEPSKAKAQAGRNRGEFRKIDDQLLAEEQAIADQLLAGGFIKTKVDVRVGFNGKYNDVTVPAAR